METSDAKKGGPIGLFISRSINDSRFLMMWAIPNYVACLVAYMLTEGVSVRISWWFSVVTGFTVGYGDNYPKTLAGQLISAEFIITSWFVLAIVLVQIFTNHLMDRNQFSHEEQEHIKGLLAGIYLRTGLIITLMLVLNEQKMQKLDKIIAWQQEQDQRNQAQETFLKRLATAHRIPYGDEPLPPRPQRQL